MNNLFELFGIDENEFFEGQKKTKEKKEVSIKKKGEYNLPMRLLGGVFQLEILAVKDKTISKNEILNILCDKYIELKSVEIEFEKLGVDDTYKIVCTFEECNKTNDVTLPVDLKIGEKEITFEKNDIKEDIYKNWIKKYPEFEGCKFHYNKEENMLIPFMEGNDIPKEYQLPIDIYIGNTTITIEEKIPMEEIREKIIKIHPEYKDCSFYYNKNRNLLFPIIKKGGAGAVKSINKWDVEIILPVEIRSFDLNFQLDQKDFEETPKVTLEKIRCFLEKKYPELERDKCELIYYKEKNFIVPRITNGEKKG